MKNFMISQFLLKVDPNLPITDKGELLAYGSKMLLVGIGIVFAVLFLLYICLSIFRYVCGLLQQSDNVAKEATPIVENSNINSEQNTSNEEIIAVIAAAIAMANDEFPDKKFRVVSFKRL